jgi:hypothetical protein
MARYEFTEAYIEFLKVVMSLLYDFDPDGVGRSIDAPPDEYGDLAAQLLGPLLRSVTASDAATEIRTLIPGAKPELIEALWTARQNLKLD